MLYQDDDFGQGGLAGIQDEVPAADIVSKQPYQSGTTTLAPQITAIKASAPRSWSISPCRSTPRSPS